MQLQLHEHRSHFGSRYKSGCCGHASLIDATGRSLWRSLRPHMRTPAGDACDKYLGSMVDGGGASLFVRGQPLVLSNIRGERVGCRAQLICAKRRAQIDSAAQVVLQLGEHSAGVEQGEGGHAKGDRAFFKLPSTAGQTFFELPSTPQHASLSAGL